MAHIFDYITDPAVQARIKAHTSNDDVTAQVQDAVNNNSRVEFGDGLYRWKHVDLRSHNQIIGESWNTIFHQVSGTDNRPGSVDGMFTVNYTNQQTPTIDVGFKSFQIKSDLAAAPYVAGALDEKQHLLLIGHSRQVVYDGLFFNGWRGDALFAGSQMSGANVPTDYVAESGYMDRCEFDGVNGNCRQAITLGSVHGFYAKRVKIRYTTNANMPGAICVEPELPHAFAMSIHIDDFRFFAIGPEGARRPAMVVDTGNLDNVYASRRGAITLSNSYLGDTDGVHVKGKRIRSFTMDNNEINGTQTKSLLLGIDDLIYINNKLSNCQPLQLGYTGADIYRVTTGGNTFYRSNGPEGAIQVHTIHGGEISRDNFVHCGHPSAKAAVTLSPDGSSGVKIHHHDFRSPYEDRCDYGVRQYSTHTMWPGSGNHDNIGVGSIIPYYVG